VQCPASFALVWAAADQPPPPPACPQVRHCALSLVGEPIMYPHINELVDLLHGRGISTFLVTNAQVGAEGGSRAVQRTAVQHLACSMAAPHH
jgi:wyosine [tRNA(Phe)-imidazoG37] synthetase (radical SAM superfamily)